MNENSRLIYGIAMLSIVVLALLNGVSLYFGSLRTASQAIVEDGVPQANVISVSGTGIAYADPDMAYVSVTVLTQAATAGEAQDRNANTMRSVIEAMKKIGLTESDMRTQLYSLQPIYSSDKEPRVVGYECRNLLRVTWRKIGEVGTVLDAAVKSGANSVGGVTFALTQQKIDVLTAEAIKGAVNDANAKAQAMASALGVRIVGKVSASIGAPYAPLSTVYELKTGTPPIVPGELQVSITVSVNYRFA